jgi:uncharacterized membrane protein YoaK (UPF0700 family)
MPIAYARALTSRDRSPAADCALGCALCLVAGSVNVSGLLLVGQTTSHMTGFVATASARTAAGHWSAALLAACGVAAFTAGSATCALLVRAGRHTRLHAEFAWPLGLEAAILLFLARVGATTQQVDGPVVVALLCLAMGLQNALITKISRAEIRTTHVTGIVTDLGIQAGRALAAALRFSPASVEAEVRPDRARTLATLLGAFFAGGILGAWLATNWASHAYIAPAVLVAACAAVPIWDDVRAWRRQPGDA